VSPARERIDALFERARGPHQEEPFDTVGFIMAFENGELDEQEVAEGFQHLIDSGVVWQLQGMYGRTAADLIRNGLCQDTHGVLAKNQ
jgi:hypothetical protein